MSCARDELRPQKQLSIERDRLKMLLKYGEVTVCVAILAGFLQNIPNLTSRKNNTANVPKALRAADIS